MPTTTPMPPRGAWYLPYRLRGWLTYRAVRRQLGLDRFRAGWPTSCRKAAELDAEARETAKLIMEFHG